jgi:hypothetical protein
MKLSGLKMQLLRQPSSSHFSERPVFFGHVSVHCVADARHAVAAAVASEPRRRTPGNQTCNFEAADLLQTQTGAHSCLGSLAKRNADVNSPRGCFRTHCGHVARSSLPVAIGKSRPEGGIRGWSLSGFLAKRASSRKRRVFEDALQGNPAPDQECDRRNDVDGLWASRADQRQARHRCGNWFLGFCYCLIDKPNVRDPTPLTTRESCDLPFAVKACR